jgi:hypothetical protein
MLPMHPSKRARVDHALTTVRPHIDWPPVAADSGLTPGTGLERLPPA